MTWGMVAIGGMSALSATQSGLAAKDATINQLNAQSKQTNAQVERANLQSIVRNSYRSALFNMQLGQAKKQAVKRGFDTGTVADQAYSAANANQAAVGVVGASASAILSDVKMKLGEEQARQADDMQTTLISYNNELDMMKVNAHNEAYSAVAFDYNGPSNSQIGTQGIISGLMSAATSYGGAKLNLGLGGGSGTSTAGLGGGISVPSYGSTAGFSSGDLGGGLRLR